MQMRQIWTRRWIAGNNTLHSSNWGGSRSQHSLLFCCFHKKAACVVGKFPLGWAQRVRSWGINSLLSHDTGLPWDYTHTACQGWHKTLHWEREEKPLSHFCWPHVWWAGSFWRVQLRWSAARDRFFWGWFFSPWGPSTQQPWENLLGKVDFLL